jgi:hypothetical protein
MAGSSRALTLKLLADINDFTKNINKADNEVSTFGDKITKFGKMAGKAFLAAGAAAGAYAIKIGIDGVKAAIEDEKAQIRLATTLKNVTNATDAQVAATEDYIDKTQRAFGVTDDKLRPSLERLARATGDVTKAQDLQKIALDVAAGSGKDLEAVSNALGKAYEGNTAALGKLGLGLSSAQLKTMSMDEITAKLSQTFAGQATIQAETFAGKMERLKIALNETKENIGFALLPMLESLAGFVQETIVPAFDAFVLGFTGKGQLNDGMTQSQELAYELGEIVRETAKNFADLFKIISTDGNSSLNGFIVVLKAIASIANAVFTIIKEIAAAIIVTANAAIRAKNALLPGKDTAEIKIPSGTAFSPSTALPGVMSGSSVGTGTVINLTVNGALDSESAARQIVTILNNSSARGTLGSASFA